MRYLWLTVLPIAAIGAAALASFSGVGSSSFANPAPAPAPQPAPASALPAGSHPVAVELFTSQGCSSCPPADTVQSRILSDPRVVAITRPVTYWDNLGWRDTLARESNTELQRGYASRRIPGAGVYTPQSVIQGSTGLVGGREAAIRQAIADAARQPEAGIAIAAAANGGRTVTLSGRAATDATLRVVALDSGVDVTIGAGENGGRRIHYTNVLVDERTIGHWTGGAAKFAIPAGALSIRGADRYAVIVRQGDAGPILAARYL